MPPMCHKALGCWAPKPAIIYFCFNPMYHERVIQGGARMVFMVSQTSTLRCATGQDINHSHHVMISMALWEASEPVASYPPCFIPWRVCLVLSMQLLLFTSEAPPPSSVGPGSAGSRTRSRGFPCFTPSKGTASPSLPFPQVVDGLHQS